MNTTHRPELSYDGIGINGPDEYRTRVAKFDKQADADKYGPLFAAAPDLLAALRGLLARCDCDPAPGTACCHILAAESAIARATGKEIA